jgi:hypothetical protein
VKAAYRVIVTGSPTFDDRHLVHRELARSWSDARVAGHPLLVAHCKTTAAGAIAVKWVKALRALGARDVIAERHSALVGGYFDAPCTGRPGDYLPVVECLVFAKPCRHHDCDVPGDHVAHGTPKCGALAEAAGIPTHHRTDQPARL